MEAFSLDIQKFLIFLLPFSLGIVLHEVAHGYAALKLGDPTAKNEGRLTLNPIVHVDPAGLMVFVITSLLPMGFVFGWAKPVPVNPSYFKNPRQGMAISSLAGPMTNFALAIVFAGVFGLLYANTNLNYTGGFEQFVASPMIQICLAGISINLVLGILNLLPIPPLDGSKVLQYFLPYHLAYRFMEFERYGFFVLILLIAFGVLGAVIGFFYAPLYGALISLVT